MSKGVKNVESKCVEMQNSLPKCPKKYGKTYQLCENEYVFSVMHLYHECNAIFSYIYDMARKQLITLSWLKRVAKSYPIREKPLAHSMYKRRQNFCSDRTIKRSDRK